MVRYSLTKCQAHCHPNKVKCFKRDMSVPPFVTCSYLTCHVFQGSVRIILNCIEAGKRKLCLQDAMFQNGVRDLYTMFKTRCRAGLSR